MASSSKSELAEDENPLLSLSLKKKKINKNEKIWENRKTKKLSLLTLEKCKKVNRKHENIKKLKI